jgi:uncharacterized protein
MILKPIEAAERYTTLDLVRGLALFGVVLINLVYFFRLSLFDHILRPHSHPGTLNILIDNVLAVLVEFKAFDLFALSFGIGIGIQAGRAAARGLATEWFLLRRFAILLVIGLAHMILISNVDILTLYALCGLATIPFLRLPIAALFIAGLAAICLPSVFLAFSGLPAEPLLREHATAATRIYSEGSFATIFEFRWHETVEFMLPLFVGVAQRTFGIILLGIAVLRTGVIAAPQKYRRQLLAICLISAVVGAVNTATNAFAFLGADIPIALAYGTALLLWNRPAWAEKLIAPIARAGQMALTNYLMQSIVMAGLFYGFGFGLFGKLDTATGVLIACAIYLAQLFLSRWWLSHYLFGPFEWLWRSLTYGRHQPIRRPQRL